MGMQHAVLASEMRGMEKLIEVGAMTGVLKSQEGLQPGYSRVVLSHDI